MRHDPRSTAPFSGASRLSRGGPNSAQRDPIGRVAGELGRMGWVRQKQRPVHLETAKFRAVQKCAGRYRFTSGPWFVVAVTALSVLATSSCGGATDARLSSTADPSSTVTGKTVPADRPPRTSAELTAALLTAEELPQGYTQDKESATSASAVPTSATCPTLFSELALRGDLGAVADANAQFRGQGIPILVQERLVSYADQRSASRPLGDLNKLLTACPQLTITDEHAVKTDYTVRPLPIPSFGEGSRAVAIGLSTPGFAATANLAVAQIGRSVVIVSVGGLHVDPTVLDAITTAAARKAQQVR